MSFSHLLFPPFRFDLVNNLLWRGEHVVPLRPKAMAVLRYLIERRRQIVSREEIFRTIWLGTVVSVEGLKVCIREIRKALRDDAKTPQFIETIAGQGYRFIGKIQSPGFEVRSQKQPIGQSPEPKAQSSHSALRIPHSVIGLIGRESELAQLHGLLEKVRAGERQIVFVTGEPGIGKTTFVDAFVAQLAPDPSIWIARGQCVEYYGTGEAYLPVLEALERLSEEPGHEPLLSFLRYYAPAWLAQLPALLPPEEREQLQRELSGTTRERMQRELATLLERLTADTVLVLVIEDLHWSDASTLELFATLARRRETARLLLIATYRPGDVPAARHPLHRVVQELHAHSLCAELSLPSLSERAVETYLHSRFPQHALPTRLARVLHQRTEGNPLFLVSVVDDLLAQGLLTQAEGYWALHGSMDALTRRVPDSLRQLITKQIERLIPRDQRLLAAASVAGAGFSAAAVAAALETSVVEIEARCEDLARRHQFLHLVGLSEWPDGTSAARYGFRHALCQHLWHERATVGQRQQWHRRIGEREEAAYGDQTGEIAAELAMHFAQGRDYRRAVRYLQQAGENALRRSAHVEAIGYFTKGLEFLKTLPYTPERAQRELALQIALGPPLSATRGWAAPEMGQAYTRARELCQQVGDTSQLFPALFGLWVHYYTRAELETARALAEQLLRLAQNVSDPALRMEAHHALGNTLQRLGELTAARTHLEQGIALYDPQRHRAHAFLYGLDDGVAGLGYVAWVLWNLGYPEQALKRAHAMLALARELSHPLSLAWAFDRIAWLHQIRREGQAAQEQAEAEIALCGEYGFTQMLAVGTIVRGWALAVQGKSKEGLAQIHQGLAAGQATGAVIGRPRYLAVLAEISGNRGRAKEGLALLAQATAVVNETGERFYEAELYRLKGQLTLQSQASPRQVQDKSQASQGKSKTSLGQVKASSKSLTPSTQHLAPKPKRVL